MKFRYKPYFKTRDNNDNNDNNNNEDDDDDTHPPWIIVRVGMIFRRGQKIFEITDWLCLGM